MSPSTPATPFPVRSASLYYDGTRRSKPSSSTICTCILLDIVSSPHTQCHNCTIARCQVPLNLSDIPQPGPLPLLETTTPNTPVSKSGHPLGGLKVFLDGFSATWKLFRSNARRSRSRRQSNTLDLQPSRPSPSLRRSAPSTMRTEKPLPALPASAHRRWKSDNDKPTPSQPVGLGLTFYEPEEQSPDGRFSTLMLPELPVGQKEGSWSSYFDNQTTYYLAQTTATARESIKDMFDDIDLILSMYADKQEPEEGCDNLSTVAAVDDQFLDSHANIVDEKRQLEDVYRALASQEIHPCLRA